MIIGLVAEKQETKFVQLDDAEVETLQRAALILRDMHGEIRHHYGQRDCLDLLSGTREGLRDILENIGRRDSRFTVR